MGTRQEIGLFLVAILLALIGLVRTDRATPVSDHPESIQPAIDDAGMSGSTRLLIGLPIDINRANARDFRSLPGIGPKLAQRLVSFRNEHGPFQRVEELLAIRGIGETRLRRLRNLVAVEF